MSEPQNQPAQPDLKDELAKIHKIISEVKEQIENMQEEILGAIPDSEALDNTLKEILAKNQEIAAFQQNTLEKNQQIIWEQGVKVIVLYIRKLQKEEEETATEGTEP